MIQQSHSWVPQTEACFSFKVFQCVLSFVWNIFPSDIYVVSAVTFLRSLSNGAFLDLLPFAIPLTLSLLFFLIALLALIKNNLKFYDMFLFTFGLLHQYINTEGSNLVCLIHLLKQFVAHILSINIYGMNERTDNMTIHIQFHPMLIQFFLIRRTVILHQNLYMNHNPVFKTIYEKILPQFNLAV